MKSLAKILESGLLPRVIGFDDGPFDRNALAGPVSLSGVICHGTRFEGMLHGTVEKDGYDATDVIADLLLESKFYDQVQLVLVDGVTLAGFNMLDLPRLHERLNLPCVAMMRRYPKLNKMRLALNRVPDPEERWAVLEKAGEIFSDSTGRFYFQVRGAEPRIVCGALDRVTDLGNVPEALRLAHLINSAIATGQSGRRA